MENIAKLVEAIASLIWPVLAMSIVWIAREPIRAFIRSWAWRKSTLKVGDFEITIDDYNQQQRDVISDLQDKIIALEKRLDSLPGPERIVTTKPVQAIRSILWVDDYPENHAQIIEQLKSKEISVVQEKTTDEAISRLSASKFDLIITDMHRVEFNREHNEAGMELISAIKEHNFSIPIIVYFGRSKRPVIRYKDIAISAGANMVISSPTDLLSAIEFPSKLFNHA